MVIDYPCLIVTKKMEEVKGHLRRLGWSLFDLQGETTGDTLTRTDMGGLRRVVLYDAALAPESLMQRVLTAQSGKVIVLSSSSGPGETWLAHVATVLTMDWDDVGIPEMLSGSPLPEREEGESVHVHLGAYALSAPILSQTLDTLLRGDLPVKEKVAEILKRLIE